jgi:mono/diheme cytochrome c family protein/glucose/arabinose dehydrogenase
MPSLRASITVLAPIVASTALAQQGDQQGEPQPPLPAAWLAVDSPAQTPEQTLSTLRVADGFRVELVACEPMVVAPVAMAFHPDGSLWVVQMPGYMSDIDGSREREPVGSIVRLRDRDGDGRMDERQVVLESLVLPRSIAFHRDGVLVIEPPHLLWARDADGDGRAELMTIVASGFAGLDSPEHAGNALTWCHDGSFVPSQHHAGFVPDGSGVVAFATPVEGQWGQAIDDFGRLLVTPNSDPLLIDLVPRWMASRTLGASTIPGVPQRVVEDLRTWPAHLTPGINRAYRAGMLQEGRLVQVTAACGPVINRDIVLGEALRGDAFVCAPCANAVKHYRIAEQGTGPRGEPVPVGGEFLASTCERFRPCDLKIGPDGALYVADISRGIIQHRIFMTSFLRAQVEQRGLDRPIDQGRIWRVVPVDRPLRAAVDLTKADDAALVTHIAGPSGHLRDQASRLLVDRRAHPAGTDATGAAVQRSLTELARGVQVDPAVRHSAASTLMLLGAGDHALVEALSFDRDARLRTDAALHAAGALHAGGAAAPSIAVLERLAQDPDRVVALAALAALGEIPDDGMFIDAVARIAAVKSVLKQAPLRAALASGIKGRSMLLLDRAARAASAPAPEDGSTVASAGAVTAPAMDARDAGVRALLQDAAAQVLAHGNERLNEALLELAARASTTQPQVASAILDRVASWTKPASKDARVLRMRGQPVGWGELIASGPRAVRAAAVLVDPQLSWPGRDGYAMPKVELSAEQRGRLLFGNCVGCHQASGAGMPPVYPPLRDSPFVTGDPTRLVRILLHGLEGEVEVDGVTYRGVMPAAPIRSDADLALLATWLRTQWGHASSAVSTEFVARVRSADGSRAGAWTATSLESAPPIDGAP